jgi:hypothetical protein
MSSARPLHFRDIIRAIEFFGPADEDERRYYYALIRAVDDRWIALQDEKQKRMTPKSG